MDAAGFETAHLAGNSLGGWIALELARRGRARTVTAISPPASALPREMAWGAGILLAMRWLGAQRAGARAAPAQRRSAARCSRARRSASPGGPTPTT